MSRPEQSSGKAPIKVVLVEDDPKFCARVRAILTKKPMQFELQAICVSSESALRELPLLKPDVVLVDIQLPGASGVTLVKRLSPILRETSFAMLTAIADWDRVFDSISAGALGYLIKREAEEKLEEIIMDLRNGGSPMSNSIARKVLMAFRSRIIAKTEDSQLSRREEEIVVAFAGGLTNKQIAKRLGISDATVRTHAQNVYKKLGVGSRDEAVRALNKRHGMEVDP